MIANRRFHEMMPARHDPDKLPPVDLERERPGLTARRQDNLPDGCAGGDVDRPEQVIRGRGDKDQPARRDHRPAIVRGADVKGQQARDAERPVLARRPKGPVPKGAPGGKLDGADAAIGRLLAQQAGQRHAPAGIDLNGIGRADLRSPFTSPPPRRVDRPHPGFIRLGPGQQPVVIRHVVVVGDDHPAHRVHRDPAPVGPAVVAGILNPAPVTGRRGKDPGIGRAPELDAAVQLVNRGKAPHVGFGQIALGQSVIGRERLGRRQIVRLHPALRHRPLLERHQWCAGAPVQHIDIALFAGQDQRRHHGAAHRKIDQRALPAKVIVPDVVVHGLKLPDLAPGGRIKRHQRRRVLVLQRRPQTAIIVDR